MARYFGQEKVPCNIYEGRERAFDIHGERVMLTKRVLQQNAFSIDEIKELDELNQMIKGGIRNESISR